MTPTEFTAASRREADLPPHVDDPDVLLVVAALLRDHRAQEADK